MCIRDRGGGGPDPSYRPSSGHGYGHIATPNAIPESGITYTLAGSSTQVFPGIIAGATAQYPLGIIHNRTPESGFEENPAHVGQYNNYWSPPRLFGNDWEEPQYVDYNIIGIQLQENNSSHTAYLYELGFYLGGEELKIWEKQPFINKQIESKGDPSDFTLGATAGSSQSKYLSGQLDHFSFYNKELNEDEIKELYLSGSYDRERAEELKTSGWYEFSNPNNIGLDSHYNISTENVVRLYHFNNDTENDSDYNATLNLIGSPIFESGDNTKFGTSNIYMLSLIHI
mgnify:CR=1 FL=1